MNPVEREVGRRWRTRAAAIAALATLAASTGDAAADKLTVTSGRESGPGSLRSVVQVANRTPGRDKIGFRTGLHTVRLDRDLMVTRTVVLSGGARVRILGPREGATIMLDASIPRNITKLIVFSLDLRRLGIGVGAFNGGARLRVVNTKLSGGSAPISGIDLEGLVGYDMTADIIGTTVTGFESGISATDFTDVDIRRSTIARNDLGVGGSGAGIEIERSTISGNAPGGGVSISYYAGTTITESTISGNTDALPDASAAGGAGGGVDADYMAVAKITNSTISGNAAVGAGSKGGGVFGNVRMSGSTVTNNSAERGGGIFGTNTETGNGGNFVLGSIVAGNTAGDGPDCAGVQQSLGGNVFGPSGCLALGPGDVLAADPGIGPLAANGGPTLTHALEPGSPAIDAAPGLTLKQDQRGVLREAPADAGAFELRP